MRPTAAQEELIIVISTFVGASLFIIIISVIAIKIANRIQCKRAANLDLIDRKKFECIYGELLNENCASQLDEAGTDAVYVKQITVRVSNMEASKQFYKGLLEFNEQFTFSPSLGKEICFLDTSNGVQLELLCDGEKPSAGSCSIGLCVADYNELYKKAKASGAPVSKRQVTDIGLHCFFICDPDGISLQIIKKK